MVEVLDHFYGLKLDSSIVLSLNFYKNDFKPFINEQIDFDYGDWIGNESKLNKKNCFNKINDALPPESELLLIVTGVIVQRGKSVDKNYKVSQISEEKKRWRRQYYRPLIKDERFHRFRYKLEEIIAINETH